MVIETSSRVVPTRALVLSAGALVIPVTGALLFPEMLGEYGALLWLTALVPAFLLAYYRGWRGVATALAAGMATLSTTQVVAQLLGLVVPEILLGVVVAYLAIALLVGWMAEALHRDRAVVADMAFTDLLTHLPNRRHARIFLENEFAAAERGRFLSVVLFDLDNFKDYNDRHGHAAGDEALQRFGEILRESTRRMDLSARFGGEEFVTVLTSTDTEGALIFADRIRARLADAELDDGARMTVSGGVATYHPSMRSPDELLASADHALYEAKRAGRNRIKLFGHAILDHALPSPDAAQGILEALGSEPPDYPRGDVEIGRSRPPLTLLPHQVTGFGGSRTALVVEDDPQVRNLVSSYLKKEGFDVREAWDVPSGLSHLSRELDVAVVDIRLPGAPGTEVVAAAKSRWPLTQLVVITGLQDAQVAAEALRVGADAYLFKPFGMPELRRQLVEALARRDRLLRSREAGRALTGPGRERAAARHSAVLEGVEALVRAVEEHHPSSKGHHDRVARYAVELLGALDGDVDGMDRDALRLGCRLHDVGEIGVPDSILNKEGGLDADEVATMRSHPVLGRQILEPLLGEEIVLGVVSWHHERWDGRGYPDRLVGESIPLGARIAAVCEALDAMTRERPHRAARTFDEALAELRKGSGTQFDPRVVRAAESSRERLRAIYPRP